MQVTYSITSQSVTANFTSMNDKIRRELESTIRRLTLELTNNIKSGKLTGQVLKVRTGRLRNSIHNKVNVSTNAVVGTVSTNVKYAAIHEYGFNGSENVKGHLRKIKQAFGKSISPKTIVINSFQRNMVMPERSFMRTALNEMQARIRNEIDSAVNRATT